MAETQSDSSHENLERAVGLFRELASRKRERATAPPSYSRKVAVILGAVMGLGYGLSTQFINSLLSPSIPFTHYPFGIIGNSAASILGMMIVCLLCALPKDSYRGALLGCFASLLLLELRALAIGSTPLTVQLRSEFSIFALIGIVVELALSIPVMLILRWTIDIQGELFDKPIWSWERIRLPLGFVAAAIALGFFSLYPTDIREAMANTALLINQGLAASTAADLPTPLRNENNVQDFLYYGEAPYTLELGRYGTFQDMSSELPGYLIEVIARFKSGWTVACLYANRLNNPVCKSYGPLNAPPVTDFRALRLHPAN